MEPVQHEGHKDSAEPCDAKNDFFYILQTNVWTWKRSVACKKYVYIGTENLISETGVVRNQHVILCALSYNLL